MPALDITALLNWIVSGLIGLIFGSIGAWYTHRLQLKRENLAWQREKEKLQERFEQEKSLLALQFQQKLLELEKQVAQQQTNQVKAEILKGIENPEEVIRRSEIIKQLLSTMKPGDLTLRTVVPLLNEKTLSWLKESLNKEHDKSLEAFKESINEMKKTLDAGDITEQEFQEAVLDLLKKSANQNQNTG